MWPETEDRIQKLMETMSTKAATYGRTVDFGLRVHVIVRETESEARAAAQKLMAFVDDERGEAIRMRALDGKSYGVSLQSALRDLSDQEGFVEDNLWTGIGRARSGCGAAIVGNPDQVLKKIQRYMDMGIRAFIFSGYPHLDECKLFGKYVLPRIKTISMPIVQNRVMDEMPLSPLGAGKRT